MAGVRQLDLLACHSRGRSCVDSARHHPHHHLFHGLLNAHQAGNLNKTVSLSRALTRLSSRCMGT